MDCLDSVCQSYSFCFWVPLAILLFLFSFFFLALPYYLDWSMEFEEDYILFSNLFFGSYSNSSFHSSFSFFFCFFGLTILSSFWFPFLWLLKFYFPFVFGSFSCKFLSRFFFLGLPYRQRACPIEGVLRMSQKSCSWRG